MKPYVGPEEIYRRHVKRLERWHFGQNVAVSSQGRLVIGPTINEVERPVNTIGAGGDGYVFKIGEFESGELVVRRIL
jgi:hypothetical protein